MDILAGSVGNLVKSNDLVGDLFLELDSILQRLGRVRPFRFRRHLGERARERY